MPRKFPIGNGTLDTEILGSILKNGYFSRDQITKLVRESLSKEIKKRITPDSWGIKIYRRLKEDRDSLHNKGFIKISGKEVRRFKDKTKMPRDKEIYTIERDLEKINKIWKEYPNIRDDIIKTDWILEMVYKPLEKEFPWKKTKGKSQEPGLIYFMRRSQTVFQVFATIAIEGDNAMRDLLEEFYIPLNPLIAVAHNHKKKGYREINYKPALLFADLIEKCLFFDFMEGRKVSPETLQAIGDIRIEEEARSFFKSSSPIS